MFCLFSFCRFHVNRNQHMVECSVVTLRKIWYFSYISFQDIEKCMIIFAWHDSIDRFHVYGFWKIAFQMLQMYNSDILLPVATFYSIEIYLFGMIKCFFLLPFCMMISSFLKIFSIRWTIRFQNFQEKSFEEGVLLEITQSNISKCFLIQY